MTARPSIPRPTIAKTSAPAAAREKFATLDLEDDDIVGISVAPMVKKSSAPPPPPSIASQSMQSVPPPPPSHIAPRRSVSDPTDVVSNGMYGLAFARSLGEAAKMCAETLAKALGARAVVIHRHDLTTGELRAVGAHGDGDFDIIGTATASDSDLVASAVICNESTVTMKFDGELSSVAPKRLHHVGAPRTVVAAPAMSWGRCLAIVEVIDADERFAGRVADAASYVAEQLARFLLAEAA